MDNIYDFVFVVLVYRNTKDLKDFFLSLSVPNAKVIVVNSFYDEVSESTFREIAQQYEADFLSVPNKGYGAGNNKGCEYALSNFKFKYLIISNADVMIEALDVHLLENYNHSIVAPRIINLNGKNQNPSIPYKPGVVMERFRYWIYTGNHNKVLWVYFAISRIKKIIFYCCSFFSKKIFSAHGAFVIFPEAVVKELHPLYDEEMFLFNEEEHLGKLAETKGIATYYAPEIKVRHKEDGSMSLASINEFERLKQSFLVYYKNWIKK